MRWPCPMKHELEAPFHNWKLHPLFLANQAWSGYKLFFPHTPGIYVCILKTLSCSNCLQRKPTEKEDAFAPYLTHPKYRASISMNGYWNGVGIVVWYGAQRMVLKAWVPFKVVPKRLSLWWHGLARYSFAIHQLSGKKDANISCGKSKLLQGTPSSSPFIGM